MNSRQKALLIVLSAVLVVPAAWALDYSHARIVRLSYVQGDVQMTMGDQAGWQKAIVNTPIREGMSIGTGQGRAEVEFENGATARIADNTVVQFAELGLEDGAKITRLVISQGTATFYTNAGRSDSFLVQAGQLTLRAKENSQFRVDVFEDGASVSTFKGSVDAESASGSARISKGQTLAFRNDAPAQFALDRNPEPDPWDRWVSERADAINTYRVDTQQYVSSSVSYGLADLSYYGGWYNYAGYGQCWRPSGVSFGWTPFYSGHWSYIPGIGYTWISYEPWGWMPYHYGRWVFSPALGWLWVPGYFRSWHPGAVYWLRTNGRIGWVPLAPKDRLGSTPRNLSHGVITNTVTGIVTGAPHVITTLAPGQKVQYISNPHNDPELSRAAQDLRAPRGIKVAGGSVPVSPTPPAAPPRRAPLSPALRGGTDRFVGDAPRIVHDPESRANVNRSPAPAPPAPPAKPGGSSGAPPAPNAVRVTPPPAPPSVSTPVPPQRVDRRESPVVSRPNIPLAPPAPPRVETPRPSPPPRVETPRPSPPPRVETPRPSPPPRPEIRPSRSETPRPAPRTESTRPSTPSSPPSRSSSYRPR